MLVRASARRVGLIGAGYISATHAEALNALKLPISAIIDTNRSAAESLARRWNIGRVFASLDEALAADGFDRGHVLVPPDRHHDVAFACLSAGKPVLVEKPLCVSVAECTSLIEASSASIPAGVNQNYVYHPGFLRLTRDMRVRAYGKPRFISVVYHAPLRQLAARQFGHWMFRVPRNILLEQAVHPLSQLLALCGDIEKIRALGEKPIQLAPGTEFIPGFTAAFGSGDLHGNIRFAVGQAFPCWQIHVFCDDGVLVCDVLTNRYWTAARTRWSDSIDALVSGQHTAFQIARESQKTLIDYVLSLTRLKPRSDSFFQSMRNSIATFHNALDEGASAPLDANFGRKLIEICDEIAGQTVRAPLPQATSKPQAPALRSPDVTVLGGTGFIGTEVVRRLRSTGLTVSVMARNTANLPEILTGEGVSVRRGDIRSFDDISAVVAGSRFVINLAHGGGGTTWETVREAMVGGAEMVARACLKAGTERLVHIGSIAGLYLGPQPGRITGATPPDPHPSVRGHYARAKALCDVRLLELYREAKLPLCILRPGLVVGAGTSPFHSGLGFFNNDQHCIGWNDGRNPLPFVLVEDVAEAIYLALNIPGIEGRCYNLVGGVRLDARQYLAELARALERPLRFHPKSPYVLYGEELGKWIIKRTTGRHAPPPSLRDLLSRGLKAEFDCADAIADLGWQPTNDRETFIRRAILVHAAQ
jgi:predicted dehydrogenase/nucleoside-diphosphate-sugar epimerase